MFNFNLLMRRTYKKTFITSFLPLMILFFTKYLWKFKYHLGRQVSYWLCKRHISLYHCGFRHVSHNNWAWVVNYSMKYYVAYWTTRLPLFTSKIYILLNCFVVYYVVSWNYLGLNRNINLVKNDNKSNRLHKVFNIFNLRLQ